LQGKQLSRESWDRSIGLVAFGRQQELHAEIAYEIRLVAGSRFEAAPGHDKEDKGRTDLVASAEVQGRLGFGRMESSFRIELYVTFELWSEIVTNDETGEPAIGSFVNKLIADFVIHIDGAKLPGEFKGQKKSLARGCDPSADGVVGVVEEELGENRDGEAGFAGIVETPLDAGIGLTQAILGLRRGILDA